MAETLIVTIGALVFMIGKIYIIDIWRWETWIRMVALAVLGVSLIVVSFLYQKRFKGVKK